MTTSLKVKNLSDALYSDSALNAARAYGIAFQVDKFSVAKLRAFGINLEKASGEGHNQLPVPSVFLIDSHGVIRWALSILQACAQHPARCRDSPVLLGWG